MFASRRCLVPACVSALVAAVALHGCGGPACLRDSDCDSEFECRRGACLVPLAKSPAGVGGQNADAGEPDAATDVAGRASGGRPSSTPNAGKSGANPADAGEGGGGGMSF
jgi:hypothetical protein